MNGVAPALVMVVDDDPSVRKSLGRVIRGAGYRVELLGTASLLLSHPELPAADCLVLDVRLPDQNGLDLQTELDRREVPAAVVFITGHGDIAMSVRAMKRGAVDFLPKPFSSRDLLEAVGHAVRDSRERRGNRQAEDQARARLTRLTPREQQVLARVVAGRLNKEIAAELSISEQTAKVHRGRVMAKMAVNSVAELVRLAQLAGIEPAPSGGSRQATPTQASAGEMARPLCEH